MKKWIKRILAALLILVLVCVLAFCGLYLGRFKTLASIRKVSAYEDGYNLYRMDIKYDYSLDDIIASGITNDQSMVDAIVKEALPLLPVSIKAPSFGCTAFTMQDTDGDIHMGRNYDFKDDTSAMLVYCTPKGGYKSVALAALNNISANTPDASTKQKLSALNASAALCRTARTWPDRLCSRYSTTARRPSNAMVRSGSASAPYSPRRIFSSGS